MTIRASFLALGLLCAMAASARAGKPAAAPQAKAASAALAKGIAMGMQLASTPIEFRKLPARIAPFNGQHFAPVEVKVRGTLYRAFVKNKGMGNRPVPSIEAGEDVILQKAGGATFSDVVRVMRSGAAVAN